jgi:ATP-binding cassette subfamily C protein CydD
VRFAYPGRHEALRGLDLTIGEGETLALIGPSGAGKTTVANLLLRFAVPTGGALTVGGRDLATIPREAWLDGVAWVPQRPHLFDGTVADNLRLGRPDATDGELRAAAERAGADAFIGRLPRGFETRIGERGSRLSGGQAQRLAIARAWLRDARLVILDEATSHLDAASETRIRDAAEALLAGRTALVISHRHRLAAVADRVALLEQGTVTRTGTPAELLVAPGQDAAAVRPSVDAGSAVDPVDEGSIGGRVEAVGGPAPDAWPA